MEIAFITTVDHNVGDDFIREGIKYLLHKHFKNQTLKFTYIHKHSPITSRYGFEKFRRRKWSDRLDNIIPLTLTKDRIIEADLVVQSGAPVYWYHKGITDCVIDNEWYQPLIKKRFLTKKDGHLINIAAGSCQTYFSDGKEFTENSLVSEYIKEFASLCQVTTVRDKLAQDILELMEQKAPLIPCSSLFAIDELNIKERDEEYVVLNYMGGGGHFSFGQGIDKEKWFREFKKFYDKIKKIENVVFSCHNKKEKNEIKKIDPYAKIFLSTNYIDYLNFYSKAKFAFVNRIHAAYPIASFGKQAIIIGADTRAKMAPEIELPCEFVNNTSYETLMCTYESFLKEKNSYGEKFKEIKNRTFEKYMDAFTPILPTAKE